MKNLSHTQKILLEENNHIHETFILHILFLAMASSFAILINVEYISVPKSIICITIYILFVLLIYTFCFLLVLKIIKELIIRHIIKKLILRNEYTLEECNIISYNIAVPVLYVTIKTTTRTLMIKCRCNENIKYVYTNKPCHVYIVGKHLLCKLVP